MTYDTLISIPDAAELVTARKCRIFDCSFDLSDQERGVQLYASGHLPEARHLHLDRDLAGPVTESNGRHPLPDPQVLARTLRTNGLNTGDQVIAYDNEGGPFAARLWWLLRWLGHDRVAVLDGTMEQWKCSGYPIQRGTRAPSQPGNFEPAQIRTDWTVGAALVLRDIAGEGTLLLDARSAPRFTGEALVMDKVAGHIPGARNRPYMDNMNEGHFKPPAVLRREFQSIMSGYELESVILYCGSGVTACHNELAMQHAGLAGARLYPGSWSEWASEPTRPVELG